MKIPLPVVDVAVVNKYYKVSAAIVLVRMIMVPVKFLRYLSAADYSLFIFMFSLLAAMSALQPDV